MGTYRRSKSMRGAGVAILIGTLLSSSALAGERDLIPYEPDFVRLVEQHAIQKCVVRTRASGDTFVCAVAHIQGKDTTVVARVEDEEKLHRLLKDNTVQVRFEANQAGDFMVTWLPILLCLSCLGIFLFILRLAVRFVRAIECIADNSKKQ